MFFNVLMFNHQKSLQSQRLPFSLTTRMGAMIISAKIYELSPIPPSHSKQSEVCHNGMVEPPCMEI